MRNLASRSAAQGAPAVLPVRQNMGSNAFETLNCFTCQSPYLAFIRIRQNEINRLPELDNSKMT
jgi:hypothetical protein